MTARTIEAMAARLLPMTEAAPWGSGCAEILTGMSKGDLLSEITSHHDHDYDRTQALGTTDHHHYHDLAQAQVGLKH